MQQVFLASAGVALLGLGLAAGAPQSASPSTPQSAGAQRVLAPRPTTPRVPASTTVRPTDPAAMVAAEQTRIVAEVERRLSVMEELEMMVSTNLQRATRLRQSILQKAFTGKL